jgi:hypothetical protein
MTEENQFLFGLCQRIAAGDPEARQEFARDVAPLVEFIARRSLSAANQRPIARSVPGSRPAGAPSPGSAAGRARDVDVVRAARRICRSLIERIGKQQRLPAAETFVQRRPWPTAVNPAADGSR